MAAERNLLEILEAKENWGQIRYEISKLPGGSSGVDMPQIVNSRAVNKILESVPDIFSWRWTPKHDQTGHLLLSWYQSIALSEIMSLSQVNVYDVSLVIRQARWKLTREDFDELYQRYDERHPQQYAS